MSLPSHQTWSYHQPLQQLMQQHLQLQSVVKPSTLPTTMGLQPVYEAPLLHPSIGHPVDQTFVQPMMQPMSQRIGQTLGQTVGQRIGQTLAQPIGGFGFLPAPSVVAPMSYIVPPPQTGIEAAPLGTPPFLTQQPEVAQPDVMGRDASSSSAASVAPEAATTPTTSFGGMTFRKRKWMPGIQSASGLDNNKPPLHPKRSYEGGAESPTGSASSGDSGSASWNQMFDGESAPLGGFLKPTASDLNGENAANSPFFCHTCNLPFEKQEELFSHLQSPSHKITMSKMRKLYTMEAKAIEAKIKASPKYHFTKRRFCIICKIYINLPLAIHRKDPKHRENEQLLREQHLSDEAFDPSAQHFVNGVDDDDYRVDDDDNDDDEDDDNNEMHPCLTRSLPASAKVSGGDDSGVTRKAPRLKTEPDAAVFASPSAGGVANGSKSGVGEAGDDAKEVNGPQGQEFVVPIMGFFCKLCLKFYTNETSATVKHCCSPTHVTNYRKYLSSHKDANDDADIFVGAAAVAASSVGTVSSDLLQGDTSANGQ